MSNSSWSMQLAQTLRSLVKNDEITGKLKLPRVAILGIGNELNGDDAAGIETIRRLRKRLGDHSDVLLIEGGIAPENFTGPIRHFAAEMVIMVDSAEMDAPAGQVAWLDLQEIDGLSASTHTLPPTVLAHFLTEDLGCRIGLIGIQPDSLDFGFPLSEKVQSSVNEIVFEIAELFN